MKSKVVIIHVSNQYRNRVFLPLMIIFPIYLYAFFSTIHDLVGWDITGTLMGERNVVTAGYLVLFGSPIYLWSLWKAIRAYFLARPEYMRVSNQEILILRPKKFSSFCKASTEIKAFENGTHKYLKIKSTNNDIKIKLSDLEGSNKSIISIFLNFGYTFR